MGTDTLSGEATLSKLFSLPSKKVYSKRTEFVPLGSIFFPFKVDSFSFKVDSFSEKSCAGVQLSKQEVTKVVSLIQSTGKIYQVYPVLLKTPTFHKEGCLRFLSFGNDRIFSFILTINITNL